MVYGFGNLGRCDDGLGVRCAEAVEREVIDRGLKHVAIETSYQLNIEDAARISEFDVVFFIDASIEADIMDFGVTQVEPNLQKIEFSMHAITPAYVLNLCQSMFNKQPDVFLVHIKGFVWDFEERISDRARQNLNKATAHIMALLVQ